MKDGIKTVNLRRACGQPAEVSVDLVSLAHEAKTDSVFVIMVPNDNGCRLPAVNTHGDSHHLTEVYRSLKSSRIPRTVVTDDEVRVLKEYMNRSRTEATSQCPGVEGMVFDQGSVLFSLSSAVKAIFGGALPTSDMRYTDSIHRKALVNMALDALPNPDSSVPEMLDLTTQGKTEVPQEREHFVPERIIAARSDMLNSVLGFCTENTAERFYSDVDLALLETFGGENAEAARQVLASRDTFQARAEQPRLFDI